MTVKDNRNPESESLIASEGDLANVSCFIEQQFPVAKVSMESYKERKAGATQTLTGLGKWWGRKPLILVRSAILGMLMPASSDPIKDREIFLKLLTMDDEALWHRKNKSIPGKRLVEELLNLPSAIQSSYLDPDAPVKKPAVRRLSRSDREELQRLVFERMPYSEKLQYCLRPEQIEGPSPKAWEEINKHLGTEARSLPEVIEELGRRRFGHRPRIGDSFCGAGSIPFEAARIGCDAYASDLNPVGTLLSWAGINVIGGSHGDSQRTLKLRNKIYDEVAGQIADWGLERNENGWVADAYLYCTESVDPETGWKVPLAPSWIIAEKTNVVAKLTPDETTRSYNIEIVENASPDELSEARNGTVADNRLVPPGGHASTPIDVIRRGMRDWDRDQFMPQETDVFGERLYSGLKPRPLAVDPRRFGPIRRSSQ